MFSSVRTCSSAIYFEWILGSIPQLVSLVFIQNPLILKSTMFINNKGFWINTDETAEMRAT